MRLFLANVGNRDLSVTLDGLNVYFEKNGSFWPEIETKLGIERAGTRLAARKIRERLWEYEGSISFPILGPAIELALKHVNRIERIVLFVTDNEENNFNWVWDSIETARLYDDFWKKPGRTRFFDKIEIVPISDPQLYDSAYSQIGDHLERTFRRNKLEKVFATVSGGIPAMNSALRSQTIDRFGARSMVIQVSEPTDEEKLLGKAGSAVAFDSWPFRRATIVRVLEVLLSNYDYEAADVLLASEGVDPKICQLCRLGIAKLNLDYRSVDRLLGELGEYAPTVPTSSLEFAKIDDLALSCLVMLRRGDLIGFLARVSAFYEVAERLIGKRLGLSQKRFVPN